MNDRLWQCECGAYFRDSMMLRADHPFDQRLVITFCPECREVIGETPRPICDEPGCTETVSCGWPSEAGYRQTCRLHANRATASIEVAKLAGEERP